jgi:hypothetical protein
MELIIAILIAIGAVTTEEAKHYTADDMSKMEMMMEQKGVNEKIIADYKETGIIDMEDADM